MTVSPNCLVKDGAGIYVTTTDGVDVTPSNTISIKLESTTDVTNWYLQVMGTDELSVEPSLTGVNPITYEVTTPSTVVTYTCTASLGSAVRFQSRVLGTGGPLLTTFGIYTLTTHGKRVGATGETRETNASFGWAAILNPVLRSGGSVLLYDDTLVPTPSLGVDTLQGAIDAIKSVQDRQEQLASEVIASDVTLAAELTYTPASAVSVKLWLNGVLQAQGAGKDYTVSGTQITWLAASGTAVPMDTSDEILVAYRG